MLLLDADDLHAQIEVSGPEIPRILASPDSLYLLVVLGFSKSGSQSVLKKTDGSLGPSLIPLLQFFRERRVPIGLTPSARSILQKHLDSLQAFERARERGANVLSGLVEFEPASDFKRTLKPYQVVGAAHVAEIPYAANFSVPGSGKTSMVLAGYSVLRRDRVVEKLLVVGPRASFEPWQDEFRACFSRPLFCGLISGAPDQRERVFDHAADYELFLASYQMVANEVDRFRGLLHAFKFFFVVDESHHVKKGRGGAWYDALAVIAPLAIRRVVLSGTPAPNAILDLRAQLELLWPSLPQISSVFDASTNLDAALPQIRDELRPFYIRVKKAELGLPPKITKEVSVPMGPVQQKIYRALSTEVLRHMNLDSESQAVVRDLRKALVIRLIQAATNPSLLMETSDEFRLPPLPHLDVALDKLIEQYSRFETPPKFLEAVRLVKDCCANGKKILVWTTFVSNAYGLSGLLKNSGIQTYTVTGALPKEEAETELDEITREKVLREFRKTSKPSALVATVQSIGESVSLHTACLDAIYLDRTFNCGLYMQSMDRIHRIGIPPNAAVTYKILISQGTIDSVVDSRLGAKMETMHQLLNDDIGILNLETSSEDPLNEAGSEDLQAVRDHLVQSQVHGSNLSE